MRYRSPTLSQSRRIWKPQMDEPSFWNSKEEWQYSTYHRLWNINKWLIQQEFPLSTTEEILTSIKGFTYASSLDLSMGYPSIPLDEEARRILTIITPFGAYEWLTLPMGVMPALDIFQAWMVNLFTRMGKNRPYPYIDNILHFKGDTSEEHIEILCIILKLLTSMWECK